jgi:N-acetylmuramic acid 6-phosphate etherase
MAIFRGETETESPYRHIEKMSVRERLEHINDEDSKVASAVRTAIPQIEAVVRKFVSMRKLMGNSRLFLIGAGTSGRFAVIEAAECWPTFMADFIIGIISGGDGALRKAVEGAEDSTTQGWRDLYAYGIDNADMVLGLAASGRTPYVVSALRICQENGITTSCITCSRGSPIISASDFPIVIPVGPEFLTGSTRMKSATAQKMALNMVTTSMMGDLGGILDNRMVRMAISNEKLVDRAVRNIMAAKNVSEEVARERLARLGLEKAMTT